MAIYRGIVKDNVVVLNGDARLSDGTAVDVYVAPSKRAVENELLRARGLLSDAAAAPEATLPEGIDRRPIEVQGQPLSETIIRERR